MARLENVTADDLRRALSEVEGATATLRIVVGINYLEGISQTELAAWYGVSRTTIHNWLARLDRLADEPVENVVYDAERPGRPPKLAPAERAALERALSEPPAAAGYDAPAWTPSLVRRYVRREFDVDYSLRHVRDLVAEFR